MPIIKEWTHAGMTCALRHGAFNAPCGYVAVPEGHPLHGKGQNMDSPVHDLDVHGGVTFTGTIRSDEQKRFWIGFDMAHDGDFDEFDYTRCIRTDDECIAETNRLAEQLAKLGGAAMKSREELEAMTCAQLKAYAKEIGCCLGYAGACKDTTIEAIESYQRHIEGKVTA